VKGDEMPGKLSSARWDEHACDLAAFLEHDPRAGAGKKYDLLTRLFAVYDTIDAWNTAQMPPATDATGAVSAAAKKEQAEKIAEATAARPTDIQSLDGVSADLTAWADESSVTRGIGRVAALALVAGCIAAAAFAVFIAHPYANDQIVAAALESTLAGPDTASCHAQASDAWRCTVVPLTGRSCPASLPLHRPSAPRRALAAASCHQDGEVEMFDVHERGSTLIANELGRHAANAAIALGDKYTRSYFDAAVRWFKGKRS
jgi:hypothetical protein